MDNAMREKAARFRVCMTLFYEMYRAGAITREELLAIATRTAEKTGVSSSGIFTDTDLIIPADDGNM